MMKQYSECEHPASTRKKTHSPSFPNTLNDAPSTVIRDFSPKPKAYNAIFDAKNFLLILSIDAFMKPTKDLFDLIHSLSPAEHKLFVQQTKRYGEANDQKKYQRMYDSIRQQEAYDEAALKVQLKDVISPQSFASWKRHLIEKLEDVIRECHTGEDDHTRMHELLRLSDLYMRRGMWSRARKVLAECKQMAINQEALSLQMQINEQERRLALEFKPKNLRAEIKALANEWVHLAKQLEEEQAFVLAFDETAALVRTVFGLSEEQIGLEVLPMLASPTFSADAQPPTFRARRMHHQGRAYLLHLAKQPQAEYDEYQRLLQLWEAHPLQQANHPRIFKIALANSLHAAAKIEKWEDFPTRLALMAQIIPGNRNEEADNFQTIGLMRLLYHYNTKQLDSARQYFNEIEAGLQHYKGKVNMARWLAFRVNMLLIYFLTEDHRSARDQLQLIQASPPTDHRQDLQALARIWEPILLLENQDADVAGSRLPALREWLRTNKLLQGFEKLVLHHFGMLLNADKSNIQSAYQSFAQALQRHRATQGHANGLDELLIWAEARASGIPMPEFIRRRKGDGA